MLKPPFRLATIGQFTAYKHAEAVVAEGESLYTLFWLAGSQQHMIHFRNSKLRDKKLLQLRANGIYVHLFVYHADEIRAFLVSKGRLDS